MNGTRLLGQIGAIQLGRYAWASALAVVVALAACSSPAVSEHDGRGIAVEIDRDARTITLDHDDIPGLMKGMTMTFAVAPEVALDEIEVGSEVEFVLQNAGDTLTVTRIEPLAP